MRDRGRRGTERHSLLLRSQEDVFAVVATVTRAAWELTRRWSAVIIAAELLQLAVFVVHPFWNLTLFSHGWVWQVFSWFQLQDYVVKDKGSWTGAAYTFAGATWLQVALCVHLAAGHRASKPANVWIIRLSRLLFTTVQEVLFISVLNIFLVPLSCDYWGRFIYDRVPGASRSEYRGRMIYFPADQCLQGVWGPHAAIMGVTAVAHIALGACAVSQWPASSSFAEWATAADSLHIYALQVARRIESNLASRKYVSFFSAPLQSSAFVSKVLIALLFHLVTGYRPEVAVRATFPDIPEPRQPLEAALHPLSCRPGGCSAASPSGATSPSTVGSTPTL